MAQGYGWSVGGAMGGDMVADRAEQFMTDWRSDVFRGLCIDRIEEARCGPPGEPSDDPVVMFLINKGSKELEDFVFNKSKSRDDYLGYVMEMVQMLKKHGGRPANLDTPHEDATENCPDAGYSEESSKNNEENNN